MSRVHNDYILSRNPYFFPTPNFSQSNGFPVFPTLSIVETNQSKLVSKQGNFCKFCKKSSGEAYFFPVFCLFLFFLYKKRVQFSNVIKGPPRVSIFPHTLYTKKT